MGDGVGIVPEEDVVAAPFDGKITSIADSLHAIGISGYAAEGGSSRAAMEVLVHVGIDTVNMQGNGFTCLVSEGELVKAGQPLLRFDREKIREAGYSDIVAVLLVNSEDLENVECICPE